LILPEWAETLGELVRLRDLPTMIPEPIVEISRDAEDLADRVAIWVATRIVFAPERIAINLSGGTTPRRVYEMLGGEDLRKKVDWRKVHFFWGDERFVPQAHAASNFRLVQESLLRQLPVPADQVHPIPTESLAAEQAAAQYEKLLQDYYGSTTLDPERPLFDITLLGLGSDGHIASLFPGSPALVERNAWVTVVRDRAPEPRITLTFPALESSGTLVFLVSGEGKRDVLARTLAGDPSLPATRLTTRGRILVFADRAAAMA
jgi:6-phosphogluconolactonase